MPTSQKQLIANQNNAQKSTGPITYSGKQIAARNAITHGLHARDNVITSPHLNESQTEFAALTLSLIEELNPDGAFQTQLVHKIANCLWRQRRATRAETAHLNNELATDQLQLRRHKSNDANLTPETIEQELEGLACQKSIPRGSFMLALLRYEMRLDIQMKRAYSLLIHLQASQKTKILQEHYAGALYIQNEPISPLQNPPTLKSGATHHHLV